MSKSEITGSCLCREVNYAVRGNLGIFQYCHCSRCRKFTGSAFGANLLVRPDDFSWTRGEALVGRYELPEAKYFATSFCKNCGSSLPWREPWMKIPLSGPCRTSMWGRARTGMKHPNHSLGMMNCRPPRAESGARRKTVHRHGRSGPDFPFIFVE